MSSLKEKAAAYKAHVEAREKKNAARREQLKQKIKLSVPVPEGLAKSWEKVNLAREKRKAASAAKKAAKPALLAAQAARIRQYDEIYANDERSEILKSIEAKKAGNIYKKADAKVLIVIRIRGINRMSPKARKVLQLFRLLQIHNAVFVKVNKATINMLKIIQPYVAYGYPSVNTIRSLIYKRGFAKIRARPGAINRIPIMSNDLITAKLGGLPTGLDDGSKIQTVEDLVYQIFTAGPRFSECTNFLWPFKLNCPKGGYRGRKRRHFNEGGSFGNWESHINSFVLQMV